MGGLLLPSAKAGAGELLGFTDRPLRVGDVGGGGGFMCVPVQLFRSAEAAKRITVSRTPLTDTAVSLRLKGSPFPAPATEPETLSGVHPKSWRY